MKITHVCLSLGTGGAEKILVDTLPLYKNLGHEMSIIQLSSILEEKKYIEEMEEKGIKVFTLSSKGFFNPLLLWKLQKTIKKEKVDIVHVHLFPSFYYISLLKFMGLMKPKLVFTEHSVRNGRTGNNFFSIIEPSIYKQFDAIVAISQNVKEMLVNYLPKLKNRIFLINNGLNIERYINAIPNNRNSFLRDFSLPENSILIMMTSRFSGPKDQETLINSLEFLPLNYYVILIGEGPKMEQNKILAKKFNDRVKFLGFRMEIPQLMKMSNINVLSSWHEGFSCVTLEGLASGKPFLGSDVSAVNDIVPDNRFLFEAGNAKDLATKIKLVMTNKDLSNQMLTTAKEHIHKYDVNETVKKHLILYKELLNKR